MIFEKPFTELNIYHIIFDSQFIVTSTLMKIQKFYESNIPKIRNHYFTLESLIHEYTLENGGNFNYFTKWSGFNFPKKNLSKFMIKFQGNISEKELAFINFLSDNIPENQDDYYIIATYRSEDVSHEIAHAAYYLDNDYRDKMDELCQNLNPELYEAIYEQLYNDGYCGEVIYDEIQTYLSTSSTTELNAYLGINVPNNIIKNFRRVFKNVMAI